jgi:hypothetical protein
MKSPLKAACSPVIEQLESRQMLAVTLADGVLTVTGSAKADNINVRTRGNQIVVSMRKQPKSFARADVDAIVVNGRGGNDKINNSARVAFVTLIGGSGNDDIKGGGSSELILGGNGNDTLRGGAGNDQIYGDAGHDNINGGKHNDTLGGDDEDELTPSSTTPGDDTLNGGPGNDWLLSGQQTDADLEPSTAGIQAGVTDPSGNDQMTGGPGVDVIDIRGRNSEGFEVGDGDIITDDEDIVPVDDLAGDEQGEDDLLQHKHAFIKIFVNGQLINIPSGAGQFGGQPVVHLHENPNPLDVRGFLIHMHSTDDSGGTARVFRLKDFFQHWGISFSDQNLGRLRVDDENALTMRVRERGVSTWTNVTSNLAEYAIQTQHNAGDQQYDQIEIRYNTPTPA